MTSGSCWAGMYAALRPCSCRHLAHAHIVSLSIAPSTNHSTGSTANEDGPRQRYEGPAYKIMIERCPTQQPQLRCQPVLTAKRRPNGCRRCTSPEALTAVEGSTESRARAYCIRGTGRPGSVSSVCISAARRRSLPLRYGARAPLPCHLPPEHSQTLER